MVVKNQTIDNKDVGGSGDEENSYGRDPGSVHNKIGLLLTASHIKNSIL